MEAGTATIGHEPALSGSTTHGEAATAASTATVPPADAATTAWSRTAENTAHRFRIAMLAPCPFPSHQGTQVFLRHLANALVADGHALSLFTYASAERLDGAFIDGRVDIVRAGGASVGMRSGPSWGRVAGDGALLRRVWQSLRRAKPDLLHVHNAEGLALGVLLKRTTRVPLVFHAHNVLGHELPLYATGAAGKQLARIAAGAFDRSLPRVADAVVCFDERQADHYASLGVASRRLHVVPLGLAHQELRPVESSPASSNHPKTNPLVVYAGNPDAYQNPELIRATFAAFRRRTPGARLRIISNHSPDAFGELARDSGVEVNGFAGPRDLARLLAEADVALCARTLWTGAPVKVLSYVSVGVPVVACGEGAAMLADFPDAGMITDASPEALANALSTIVSHRGKFDCARMRAATDISRHVRAYRDVYESVIR